jgi:hypothetical protein
MDRAYIDFERLARFNDAGSFFVTRAKSNFRAQRRYSRAVDRATGKRPIPRHLRLVEPAHEAAFGCRLFAFSR